jgi:hypothetical protein
MDLKHQKYELNESMGEDELIRSLKVDVNVLVIIKTGDNLPNFI